MSERLLGFLVFTSGFIFGSWLIGFRNLNPYSIEWLQGDARLAQIGYEFFWRSPWAQFPFNSTPKFGLGWKTGLNQSSQNSLVPVLFKPIAQHSSGGFQFQGIWIATSYGLHALVGFRIFSHLALVRHQQLLGAAFLVLSPALFSRIGTLLHPQLAAHWMILLSILMYMKRSRVALWLPLVMASISVHVYISVIVIVVAVACSLARTLDNHEGDRRANIGPHLVLELLTLTATVVSSLYLLGFGAFFGNPSTYGVGTYRTNVLAFFNPAKESYGWLMGQFAFFQDRQWLSEENEGFLYLGLGTILSIVVFGVLTLKKYLISRKQDLWMWVASALLFMVAVSNNVAVGSREISIPLAASIQEFRQVFRAAPRFAWLLYYLLMIYGWWTVAVFAKTMSLRFVRLSIPWCIALIQIVDVGPGIVALQHQNNAKALSISSHLDPQWGELLGDYSRIFIVPVVDANEDDVPMSDEQRAWFYDGTLLELAWLASINDVALNYGFCSRSCMSEALQATRRVRRELDGEVLDSRTIYIFSTVEEWRKASEGRQENALMIDGLFVLLG